MKVKYIASLLALAAVGIAGWQVVSKIGGGGSDPDDPASVSRRPLLTQKNARVSAVKPLTPTKGDVKSGTPKKRRDPAAKRRLALRFPGLDPSLKWDGVYRDENGKE